ncbi:helix-turn-helix domain-containing protein [Cohnella candidum]|uniref:helix-turn-helix domain-containing protein n=1 Tax=Cohnella candidum TaxID=2674991 RepID=UPI0013DDED8B|nr:helix-turn-helix domain-containing protein [Cohnella candidum]
MSDLGALLRKAREQRGYTLDDVQEATKIRKRYLEAIETGDYKVLPGSFYVRAFVKTYAETVGLDAEEVLRLYQKELPKPASVEAIPAEPMMKKSRRSTQHNDRWGKVSVTLLMWLFPILIVAVIYVYLQQNADKTPSEINDNPISTEIATPSASTPVPSETVTPSPSPSESSAPPSPAVTYTLGKKSGTVQYVDVSTTGARQLVLEVTGDCWIDVNEKSRSGKSLYSKMIRAADAPQTLYFDLTQPIYVNMGRADNAKVTIDGTPFDDGDKADRARFLFTPVDAAAQP